MQLDDGYSHLEITHLVLGVFQSYILKRYIPGGYEFWECLLELQ